MYILGISAYNHDSAAVLLKDGHVVAAAEEERFLRHKHNSGLPRQSIKFCLNKAGISVQEIDYVVFYEKPFLKFRHTTAISREIGIAPNKIFFTEHHLSHAASVFLSSPFQEAAIMIIDGAGENPAQIFGFGKNNKISILDVQRFPHSVGLLYSAYTAFLGFGVNEGEYKVMGMAPYGEPKFIDKIYKTAKLRNDGSLCLDMSYFSHRNHAKCIFTSKFEELFGIPRNPKSRFVTSKTSLYDSKVMPIREEMESNQYYADIASSIQKVTEKILVKMANRLYEITKTKNLCIAGDVGLNCVANYKILQKTPFEEIYLQPACGDSGSALGTALYFYYTILNNKRDFVLRHAYFGEEYSQDDIKGFLDKNGIKYEKVENEDKLLEKTVDYLTDGKIIGWHQGRSEWGPRALGNRSILADPRKPGMKDILNIKIKFREPYRPFAPSILAEYAQEYFDFPTPDECYPLRFMLMAVPVRDNKRNSAPATTHIDGTSRLQAVHRDTNPRYHRLISKFNDATGVPIVLNTSFNVCGEPIVNTPEDALNTFRNSGMDVLVVGNYIVTK